MDPINYLGMMPQQDFLRDIQGGLQLGAAYRQIQDQRRAQQVAQQQADQYQTDVAAAMANPTPQNFAALSIKYPQQREAVKQAWDGLSTADQKAEGDTMAQASSALLAGKPEIAKQVVQAQIDARKNSGLDTSHYDNALSLLNADPKQAQGALGFALSHISDPKNFAQTYGALQETPGKVADQEATTAGKQADNAAKNAAMVGQTLGSLQGKNAKPAQAITAIKSLHARGMLSADDAQALLGAVPTDLKELDTWLGQQRAAGMKPDDQQKYVTPDANAKLQSETTRRGQDIQHQQWVQEQEDANAPGKANEALAQRIAAYKQPPLGQFALNKPWGQATMDRVAEINPSFDAATYPARAAAIKSFTNGPDNKQIESANIAMNHLATLKDLALAQKNGNWQLFNKLANQWASATGGSAPTNLAAAAQMIGPEVVKTISGVAGTGEERARIEKALTGNGSYSPEQVLGAVATARELFAGRLTEKKRSYERATKLNDFEDTFLSPAAKSLLAGKSGGAAKPSAHPEDIDYLLNKYGSK